MNNDIHYAAYDRDLDYIASAQQGRFTIHFLTPPPHGGHYRLTSGHDAPHRLSIRRAVPRWPAAAKMTNNLRPAFAIGHKYILHAGLRPCWLMAVFGAAGAICHATRQGLTAPLSNTSIGHARPALLIHYSHDSYI